MPQKIFLSYGHDSYAAEVLVIKADLEAHGHEVWFDLERLQAGVDWDLYIEDGLRWCDKVILAMTPHSVRRRRTQQPLSTDGFCLNEIAKAIQLNKSIVPIQLARLQEGPPTSICRLQAIDMTDCLPIAEQRAKYESRLAKLLNAIEQGLPDTGAGQARLLQYLRPLNFDSEISRHIARFAGRRWLLDALDAWIEHQPESRVFWIVAGPGIGKTAFATHLCHSRGDVIACHFCMHGNADKTDARRAVLSLVYQLSTHLPEYARRLQELPIEDEYQKDAQTLFDNLLVDPLSELQADESFSPPDTPMLVVIDALDEAAGPDQRSNIALIIGRNWERTPPWLKLVVTSRPETEVVTQLQTLRKLQPFVVHAEGEENLQDARAFLQSELGPNGTGGEATNVEALLERSEGNFLYLKVVLDEIQQGRMSLDRLDTFPLGMGGYYQQFFERRFTSLAAYREQFRPIVETIIAQRGPLPLGLLASATQISPFAVDDAFQVLGSLFPIQSGGPSKELTVTTLHKSLRDWLTSRDKLTGRLTSGPYAVDVEAGESCLANACWHEYVAGSASMSAYAIRHLIDHMSAARRFDDLESILRNQTYIRARNAVVATTPDLEPPMKKVTAVDPSEIEISRLEQVLRTSEADFETVFDLGVLYGRSGRWEKAIEHLTSATKIDPTHSKAHLNLSLALAEVKDFEHALSAVEEAARLSNEPAILLAMGLIKEGLGEQQQALKSYSEGLLVDPSNVDLALTVGNMYGKMGDSDRAIEHYEHVLRIEPTNLFATSNLAYVYDERGDRDKALEYYQRAVEFAPDDAKAWYDLGHANHTTGNLAEALPCFQRSYALDEKFYRSCLSLALAHEDNGELEDSVGYYARAMSLTDNPDLREAIGRQIVKALKISSELAPCFEPAVALEYSELWLQINRSKLGTSLSRFRILKKLGEGPTGTVYKAECIKSGRLVAIKILASSLANDPARLIRLLEQAKAASALSHPNICTIYETDEADGVTFIAMEFVDGTSLRSRIDGKGCDYRTMVRLATQVAEGLISAHNQGIIHGAIKPENILLAQDGSAKIVDFGMALPSVYARSEPPTSLDTNATGTVSQTALYRSPEQTMGENVDDRSDIFSFGVVLYEMARDLVPLEQRMPLDVMHAIALEPLPRGMLAQVPPEMASIIVKATEKNPADRYQSAGDLADDLHGLSEKANSEVPES